MADHATDEAAIYDVLMRQRRAARAADFEAYAECFAQGPYLTRWYASPSGGTVARQGWEEIATRLRQSMVERRANPLPADDPGIVENFVARIAGDMAWVTYTRRYPDPPDHRSSPEPAFNMHVLERQEGKWKIVFFGFLEPGRGRPDTARIRLDVDGTILWADAAAQRALAVEDDIVIRAGRLRLRDSRAQQQFAAALRWAAGLDQGVAPARGAVPLVLDRGEGLPVKVWWVVSDNGAILLTLGDAGQDAHRLDAAAIVYRLSPAQRQVAGQIVEGLALPAIAKAMRVRPSTVRTHLERMFEKIGVRNQTALVRALLSAAAPF
jgi:DNA-binding CsgD family transcriptional regulator